MSVHFNQKSMATILSMNDFSNVPGVRIYMDSDVEKAINVSYKGRLVKFKECEDGLYYFDTKNKGIAHQNNKSDFFLLFCFTKNSQKQTALHKTGNRLSRQSQTIPVYFSLASPTEICKNNFKKSS